MEKTTLTRSLVAGVSMILLTACGGGEDDDEVPPAPPSQGGGGNGGPALPAPSIQGLWADDNGGVLVTGSGEFWGLGPARGAECSWILYQGQASASGSTVSGQGSAFCGTAKVNGSISGTFTSTTMTVTFSASGLSSQTASLTREAIYNQSPSLTQYAGTYRSDNGATFVMTSSGGVSGSNGSCSFSGTARPSEDGKNYFRFNITYGSGCGVLAGRQSSGVAVPSDSRTLFYGEKLTDGSLGQGGVLVRI